MLNWKTYDDNGLTRVTDNNYSVRERFTHPKECNDVLPSTYITSVDTYKYSNTSYKSIIRTSVGDIRITHVHYISDSIKKKCASDGKQSHVIGKNIVEKSFLDRVTHEIAYIAHYPTKTAQEYHDTKLRRKSALASRTKSTYMTIFWGVNARTKEKENILKK